MCVRIPNPDVERRRALQAERRRLLECIGDARANADGNEDYRIVARLQAQLDDVESALRGLRRRAA